MVRQMSAFPLQEGRGPPTPEDTIAPTVAIAVPGTLMAEALARLLRDHRLHVVGCYTDRAALLDKIRRCRPGVVVVDAALERGALDPLEFLDAVRSAGPATRIVVLAGEVDAALTRAVLHCGASAVILKSCPTADAVATLTQVMHGRTSFPASVLASLVDEPPGPALSRRQLEVLERLARGHTNQQIARELFISTNTVKFHVRAIYDRLGVSSRVDAARALAEQRMH